MRTDASPDHDSYGSLLVRLDAATASLSTRAASLDKSLAAVSLLLGPYESAVRNWERRRLHVSGHLAGHYGPPQSCAALGELHEVAVTMEAMFRDRAQRIRDKLSAMQSRREAIDKSLMELKLSHVKLASSRLLALPDAGLLSDLREARKAVVMAEALIEVKGY